MAPAAAFRGRRVAALSAAGCRKSGIWNAGDAVAPGNTQLGQPVAQAGFQSRLPSRPALYARRVQRYPIELDASGQFDQWLVLRRTDPDGGPTLSDRPGIGFVQARCRLGAVPL